MLIILIIVVPGSWLIRPMRAIHDLDNIRMSVIKENDVVEADFELEHILVEGNLILNDFRPCHRERY
jgi:hypothetical protein